MKKIMAMALIGVGLLSACSDKVDREGSRDLLVKQLEASGMDVDSGCVDGVFDEYTDEELTAINDEAEENSTEFSETATELFTKLSACVTAPTA